LNDWTKDTRSTSFFLSFLRTYGRKTKKFKISTKLAFIEKFKIMEKWKLFAIISMLFAGLTFVIAKSE
jgi:hypothetical protein